MPTCDICGAPSNGFECDWPVEGFVRRPAKELKIGDEVRRFSHAMGKRRTRGVAIVTHIQDYSRYLGVVRVVISITWPWKVAKRSVSVSPNSEFMVKGIGHCGAHVCDACMIERDADRMVICKNHWQAWEMVA